MTRRRSGFALVELVVALLLAALVVAGALRQLLGSRQAEASVTASSDRALALDLGADLLVRQVRRAGFVPSPPPPDPTLDTSAPTLLLTLDAAMPGGDAVRVRYLDDTVAGGAVLRDLRFIAARDGRGEPQLYRATATGNRQPLVQGIASVRVEGWADAEGLHDRAEVTSGRLEPWSLLLSLAADDGSERAFVVPLPSRPLTEVVMGP